MTRDDQKTCCELVAQLLLIDGAVTDEERAYLIGLMDHFGFSDADKQSVYEHVNIDDDIEAKVARLSDEARNELVKELETAAAADGNLGPGERDVMRRVQEAIKGSSPQA